MKYGIAFTLLAALIAYIAITNGGSAYLLLWPALSFLLVAFAYFGAGPGVFGKQQCGTLKPIRQILLAPFLLYLWLVWNIVRLVSREGKWKGFFVDHYCLWKLVETDTARGIQIFNAIDQKTGLPCIMELVPPQRARTKSDGLFYIVRNAKET